MMRCRIILPVELYGYKYYSIPKKEHIGYFHGQSVAQPDTARQLSQPAALFNG
jgi:hypothetical protein